MIIRNKAQFFQMWEAGLLGNRTRLWRDPQQALFDATMLGIREVGFREIGKTGGGAWEKVPTEDVTVTTMRWEHFGRKFIMDDAAPNHLTTLCGEVCRTYRGLEGSLAGNPRMGMRDAMRKNLLLPRSGATIHALVQRYMDPSSQEDLWALLDLYPDAAVEFSCFTVNVGVIPHRNTIFWEVRNY